MTLTTLSQFNDFIATAPKVVIADVETKGRVTGLEGLLGIALGWANTESDPVHFSSAYVPVNVWDASKGCLRRVISPELLTAVRSFLRSRELVGHNVEYDRAWIDSALGIKSAWIYDTMILAHLTDRLQLPGGYGLKTLQVRLLGYEEKGNVEIERAIKDAGGKPGPDMYLAPLEVLSRYAALDAKSTAQLFHLLLPRLVNFNGLDYRPFYRWVHSYNRLLARVTRTGVDVDRGLLEEGQNSLKIASSVLRDEIRVLCRDGIRQLEEAKVKETLADYKTDRGKLSFLSSTTQLRIKTAFNFNSNDQKAALFYDVFGIPCTEFTETGKRKIDKSTIASMDHPVAKKFVDYSETEKLGQMIQSYLDSLVDSPDGKIHFPYNITGTKTGRLGGFKPYALNMPFDSEEAMRPFSVPAGFEGIHSDLKSAEPFFIAALSKDPTLLKVHRDGLGDVYLDFALVAFPNNQELREAYDPNLPVSDAVKARFKDIRNVCKLLHLAVGYTGSKFTVSKNLTKAGYPTTEVEADVLVKKYWELFSSVYDLNNRCKQLVERRGYLINPFGRIVLVPRSDRKDTMNRLIQSSGHDALTQWVKNIVRIARTELPEMRPLLVDTHDSTSFITPTGTFDHAKDIFERALASVSAQLDLGVTLSADTKAFNSLYGLKHRE